MLRLNLYLFTLIIFIFLLWGYKLSLFPGLHADEAWFGVKAYEIIFNGKYDWHGMNYYTGAFQQTVSAFFLKHFGLNLISLRIVGFIFNAMGLIILVVFFILKKANNNILLIFLLLMSQSVVWLVYPRIAWEVNSFSLFFLSIFLWSFNRISNNTNNILVYAAFLYSCLLGSYNHIIFACIPLSALLATIFLYIRNHQYNLRNVLLLILCVLNIALMFYMMNFISRGAFDRNLGYVVLFFILLILIESAFINKIINEKNIIYNLKLKLSKHFVVYISILFSLVFFYNHGLALYDVLSNYKILMHIYSYNVDSYIKIVYQCFAAILLIFLFYQLYLDIIDNKVYAIFLNTYMGLLSLFTTNNSPRYYLSLMIIIFIYLSYHFAKSKYLKVIYIGLIVLSSLSIGYLFIIYDNHIVLNKNHYVNFGKTEETSSHFFSITPVIDFLTKNKISKVDSNFEKYFIQQPIKFMQLCNPWEVISGKSVVVDYGETERNGGFIIIDKD